MRVFEINSSHSCESTKVARAYIGTIEDANLIKLHRFSGKVSYLACPDFESDPHPITTETTKVWLRTLRVGFYETADRINPPLLDRKELMLESNDERRSKFERLSSQELKHGFLHDEDDFLTREVWRANLQMLGFEHRGHRLVRRKHNKSTSVVLPKRCSKYGVGKQIGGAVYVHCDFEHVLGEPLAEAKSRLPPGFEYTVVKHNEMNGNFSFIHCPDFDESPEPSTGSYTVLKSDGSVTVRPGLADPFIYHHKWLFVDDDYRGFDVEESKRRSAEWMALPNVDTSLIGRASYWNNHVVPQLKRDPQQSWLRSEEVRKRLGWTTCELAHQRDAGQIRFKKVGRAYLYQIDEKNAQE